MRRLTNVVLRVAAAFAGALLSTSVGLCQPVPLTNRQSAHSFSLSRFYDTPDPLPPGKPGELIRAVPFEMYRLPLGVSAVRILYHSRSANGGDVASSGVVLYPDKKPPAGGWPVIAWAHDERGVARDCAPSLARNLQHGPFLSMYVNEGYAVVASDYTGLGTRFRHAFADAPSNASDIIHAVAAARSAVHQLGQRWVAMGTGKGAMAVVSVAGLEQDIHDPNYLGSIVISRLEDLQNVLSPRSHPSVESALLFAYGVKTVFPEFNMNGILTDSALALYDQIDTSCNLTGVRNGGDATTALKPNWESDVFVKRYFERNNPGSQPGKAALLVLTSQDDPSGRTTTEIVNRLCLQGNRVQLEKYAEADPGRVIGDSVRDQMAWIQGRLHGLQAPSNCASSH